MADRPKVIYFTARKGDNLYLDPSLLDPREREQLENLNTVDEYIERTARKGGLADTYKSYLKDILRHHMSIFRSTFSAGPPAKTPPLKTKFTSDAKPVKV